MQEASSPAQPSNEPASDIKPLSGHPCSLDDFNLIRVIGRGTYGKVFMVEFKKTKEIYAMKVMKKNSEADGLGDSILTEKLVLETVPSHPFLIGLYSFFQTASRAFFVMEIALGGDLLNHMEKFLKLPENQVRFYSAEIAVALDYLHRNGIIFRDLKLDNVLLDHEGHIKLTDYGWCKTEMKNGVTTNSFCGAPAYRAPEVLREENYGNSVDWWALGVIIYEMLIGTLPFRAENSPDISPEEYEDLFNQEILEAPLRIPMYVSAEATDVIEGFLNKNPQERLGCDCGGFMGVASHSFYRGVDWYWLEQKKVPPPYRPPVDSDRDVDCFSSEFTEEQVCFTPDEVGVLDQVEDNQFEGFEYTNLSHWMCDIAFSGVLDQVEDNQFERFEYTNSSNWLCNIM